MWNTVYIFCSSLVIIGWSHDVYNYICEKCSCYSNSSMRQHERVDGKTLLIQALYFGRNCISSLKLVSCWWPCAPSTLMGHLRAAHKQCPYPHKKKQAGFRAGRSTTELIFNLRILCEKQLQHQRDLCHVFIDFKKAFDRVWHGAPWATMKNYNIDSNITSHRTPRCLDQCV
eukprot:TRINITY_DN50875_c0_g1_i13.p2 TRINITY_DN50875_c0_g1~~TRINITY_DN50875_c0_g1_i13.p2  ORF type:complete len:172 (+),score=14.72 TRINITY_DN50875_c0_g1_i13:3007-3522(+)